MRTHYITTDLDLEGPADLSEIAKSFGENVVAHYCGPVGRLFRATFGLAGLSRGEDADITFLCMMAETLDGSALAVWRTCTRIEFNVGYEAGAQPRSWRSCISAETLTRLSKLGADVVITIYPAGTYDA